MPKITIELRPDPLLAKPELKEKIQAGVQQPIRDLCCFLDSVLPFGGDVAITINYDPVGERGNYQGDLSHP